MRDHLKDEDVGLIADRLDSEMLRCFCDRQMDRQTDRQMDICDCRVAFATEIFYHEENLNFKGIHTNFYPI